MTKKVKGSSEIVQQRIEFEENLSEEDRHQYEMMFQSAQKSNNHHYRGLYPHFREIKESQDQLHKRLDNIELLLKALIRQ